MDDLFWNKADAYEAHDDRPLSPPPGRERATIGDVITSRYTRRGVLGGLAFGALGTVAASALLTGSAPRRASAFDFAELQAGVDGTHHVADGYRADILIRWGDPIFADAPEFDPHAQTAERQLRQFGYNNDYTGFLPLNRDGTRGLLCVNHEYTDEELMFPGLKGRQRFPFPEMTREMAEVTMAAHGGSVVVGVLERGAGGERPRGAGVRDSRFNRRITALETGMTIDGPAAGHPRMKTAADPSGRRVIGTLNNCAGGLTPWGTYLMAEENFHGYFWQAGDNERSGVPESEHASYARYGVPGNWYPWGKYFDRFDVAKEPHEPNRFGWVVEVDPLDPASTPVKHTALGRFRHEGAAPILSADGRVVVYMGDDARFDYVYRFVSADRFDPSGTPDARAHNMTLLSQGTLSVARYLPDGSVRWLELTHGAVSDRADDNGERKSLTSAFGFPDQASILIDTRLAADVLGATPMDRPEDVEPTEDGRVYVMLTNNTRRQAGDVDAANPRPDNRFGHIIEMRAPAATAGGFDHTAPAYTWDLLVTCGDPSVADVGARFNPETTADGWFANPDNCAVDARGRLWIATDQGRGWNATGRADGLYALETDGEGRGTSRLFFRVPVGAELCGPTFTPDNETVFLAVQHPAASGTKYYKGFERNSTFEDPATRWPDFDDAMPPRPSVVAVRRKGGGEIA